MSDENLRRRDEAANAEDDVEAHRYVIDAPDEDDPEKKRRRRLSEDVSEDEPGKRKK
jgi:hypothetical protein